MGTLNTRGFAVVTGGTSGIGKELARCFLQDNHDVLIVGDGQAAEARTDLATTDGSSVFTLECDLSTREGVDKMFDYIEQIGRPLDAIAINAGVGVGGEFEATDLEAEINMIELNCTSVVRIAKRVIQDMLPRGKGKILITSSVAATMPAPYETVYGATKAFDLQLAEGLRAEVKDKGITVTALQPGPTETNFFQRADLEDTKVGQQEKDDPAQVAKQGYEALKSGKDKVYAGSFKTRMQGLATEVLGEEAKAKRHAKLSKPLDKKD